MDELLRDFLTETNESMELLDAEIVRLEQSPNDPALLGNIFRLVHTVKGTCGFLGLPRLEAVAHAAENVLGKFRDGELAVTPEAVTLIFESLDCIKSLLAALEETETEPAGDDAALIARVNALAGQRAAAADTADPPPAAADNGRSLYERVGGMGAIDAVIEVFYRKVLADELLKPFFANVDLDVLHGRQTSFVAKVLGGPDSYDGRDLRSAHQHLVVQGLRDEHFDAVAAHLTAALAELEVAPADIDEVMALVATTRADILDLDPATAAADSPAEAAPAPAEPAGEAKQSTVAAQSIRVNVDLLEGLMNLVSEMVLTRNQLLQILRSQGESEFAGPLQRLNQITTELQEGVMKTRMQPIGHAWAKLPRIVRDLATELDKKIDLEMNGADTELDRQVLELIKDPLTHMVRNSGDHGLEIPAERVAAGKPATGKITLNAFHEGGHIIIEISDDGRGLDIEKIKAKAVSSNLATQAEIDGMTDQQIQQFIMQAGFSTAERVTSVSGRGVGMDVVRSNIERIGGSIEVKSWAGKGSAFVIKIPLTLSIVSALIVECSGERFAVPQISVLELVRTSASSECDVEFINGTPVLRLRNRLLPLVALHELLGLDDTRRQDDSGRFIIVTQVGANTFGIIVDRVFDTEEIVVKPVAPILRDIAMFSGNTILGDGGVVMILDPNGMASASGQIAHGEVESTTAERAADEHLGAERIALLLFHAGGDETPRAVPLSLVNRLEEFDVASIESANGQPVVQYYGQLMPLIPLVPEQTLKEQGRQPVLVLTERDRSLGLIVDAIVDIVEGELVIELATERPGVMGTAVVDGKATDILDAGHYLGIAFRDCFGGADRTLFVGDDARRVLLVDDSPFFRNLLTPLLLSAGYSVTSVESGSEALRLAEAGEAFDVILSDIEMPDMNGFEFARAVRGDDRWRDVPLVALSARATPGDLDRGRQVGFTDYVAKFDREALFETLTHTLANSGEAA